MNAAIMAPSKSLSATATGMFLFLVETHASSNSSEKSGGRREPLARPMSVEGTNMTTTSTRPGAESARCFGVHSWLSGFLWQKLLQVPLKAVKPTAGDRLFTDHDLSNHPLLIQQKPRWGSVDARILFSPFIIDNAYWKRNWLKGQRAISHAWEAASGQRQADDNM
ncbi:MAG: hypothetical protein JWO70_2184 [Betaproteobacteria bacterium]|nr:hypothetical protein [Betaproteobacteria bacterium]